MRSLRSRPPVDHGPWPTHAAYSEALTYAATRSAETGAVWRVVGITCYGAPLIAVRPAAEFPDGKDDPTDTVLITVAPHGVTYHALATEQ